MLKVNDTAIRKLVINSTTLHSLKVNETEVFNDLIYGAFSGTWNRYKIDFNTVTFYENYYIMADFYYRKDGLELPLDAHSKKIQVKLYNKNSVVIKDVKVVANNTFQEIYHSESDRNNHNIYKIEIYLQGNLIYTKETPYETVPASVDTNGSMFYYEN